MKYATDMVDIKPTIKSISIFVFFTNILLIINA